MVRVHYCIKGEALICRNENRMKLKNVLPFLALTVVGINLVHGQASPPRVIQTVYEVFSLSKSEAAAMQREEMTGREFYARMMTGLESGKVTQKKFTAVRSLPSQVSSVESISEYLYPTEFEPPNLRNAIDVSVISGDPLATESDPDKVAKGPGWQAGVFPVTPALPAAFASRKLGDTIEVEVEITEGAEPVINLRFATTHIGLMTTDLWGAGLAESGVPRFGIKQSKSAVVLKSGVPSCVGTVSPGPEEQPEKGEEEVWFAFFTVTLIEVKE